MRSRRERNSYGLLAPAWLVWLFVVVVMTTTTGVHAFSVSVLGPRSPLARSSRAPAVSTHTTTSRCRNAHCVFDTRRFLVAAAAADAATTDDNNSNTAPFAVVVQAEIEPDRMHEFLTLIETNAVQSRKEPGCLRFDVLRSRDSPTQFFFYELYRSEADIEHHKQQPHYNLWAQFKESGGVIHSTTHKADAEFLT
jgi:(4S)-4-hydroxy-5-phosphonooxypentane-2,3-dione isomerase